MKITTKQEIALKQILAEIELKQIEIFANSGSNDIALIQTLLNSHNKPKTDFENAFKEKVKILNNTIETVSTTMDITDKKLHKEFFDNGIKSFLLEWGVSNNE